MGQRLVKRLATSKETPRTWQYDRMAAGSPPNALPVGNGGGGMW
jgi:hypothetical protein